MRLHLVHQLPRLRRGLGPILRLQTRLPLVVEPKRASPVPVPIQYGDQAANALLVVWIQCHSPPSQRDSFRPPTGRFLAARTLPGRRSRLFAKAPPPVLQPSLKLLPHATREQTVEQVAAVQRERLGPLPCLDTS